MTHDSPFALVVGSYLVATKRIHPSTLNNFDEFRAQLLARFQDAITGNIALEGDQEILRDTLNLVALIRPVDPESESFRDLAAQLIDKPLDKIQRALQLLYEAGVLVKRGRFFRIVPDLLGDYVLEQCCIRKGPIGSLGYAERALGHADAATVARIAVNISSLDWRLTAADRTSTKVIEAVWMHIEGLFVKDHDSHIALLEGVATAAYYQPKYALHFYDRVHAIGASDEKLARLLKNTAMNIEYVEEACARLWDIGKDDQRRLNQNPSHPVRLLKELVAIEPRKPVEYCERIVEFAIRGLSLVSARQSHHQLFEVLDAALAAEGHTTESRGHAFTISQFRVRRGAVATMRQRIIDFLLDIVPRSDIAKATRAIACIGSALRYPMHCDDQSRAEWATEFCETLDKLKLLVLSTPLDPVLHVSIIGAVTWHSGYAGSQRLPMQQL